MDAVTGLRHGVLEDLEPAIDVAGKWLAALREANQSPDHADDRVSDPSESDPTTALALLETNVSGFDDSKLPGFLSREQPTTGQAASAESLSRLANRRRETLSGIYAELLRSPHSDVAFERIARAVASKALAWDSLPDEALARVKNQPEPAMPVFSGGTDVAIDLPYTVVLEAADKRPGWLDGTVLPELRAADKSRLAADLARAALLRTVPAAEFLTAVGRAETQAAEIDRFGSASPGCEHCVAARAAGAPAGAGGTNPNHRLRCDGRCPRDRHRRRRPTCQNRRAAGSRCVGAKVVSRAAAA
jgi:hypothetical protein